MNEKILKELGTAIRRQRKSLGLNQKELSELARVGINFVSQLEAGKPSIHLSKLLDVLQAIGLQITLEPGKLGIRIKNE